MTDDKIHFVASQVKPVGEAAEQMQKRYDQCDVNEAEVIVALGHPFPHVVSGWCLH